MNIVEKLDELAVNMQDAYHELSVCRLKLASVQENLQANKYGLEVSTAELTIAGTITGKNDAERKASAREILKGFYQAIDEAERIERRTRAEFENAERRVEYLRALLRIAEITTTK